MARLFYSTKTELEQLLKTLQNLYIEITEPVRPGRNYVRDHQIYKRIFHFNRKYIS